MARYASVEARNRSRRDNYAQTRVDGPRRQWTQEEDRAITTRRTSMTGTYAANLTDRELSARLGRSVQAIQIRRHRLGGAA